MKANLLKPVLPGVWKVHLGQTPEAFTPVNLRVVPAQEERLGEMPLLSNPPFDLTAIRATKQKLSLIHI